MRIVTFVLLVTVSSTIFGKSIECQVLKERIFNEVKYIETLRVTNDNKTSNSQPSQTSFADAYAPLIQHQRKLTSELTIEQYTKEYRQKCE